MPKLWDRLHDPELGQLYLLKELCQEECVISQTIRYPQSYLNGLSPLKIAATQQYITTQFPPPQAALCPQQRRLTFYVYKNPVLPKTAGLPRRTSVWAAGHKTGSFLLLSFLSFVLSPFLFPKQYTGWLLGKEMVFPSPLHPFYLFICLFHMTVIQLHLPSTIKF